MDITNVNAMIDLRKRYNARFQRAFAGVDENLARRLGQLEDSIAAIEVYEMLLYFPGFKEFKGKIEPQSMAFAAHMLANKEWHDVVEIPRADIQRDTHGKYAKKFDGLGEAAARHPEMRFAEVLMSGFGAKDYTGKNFFDEDKKHLPNVLDSKLFTNKMTAKPSANSWELAKRMLNNMTDAGGVPILAKKKVVVCSPKWETTFIKLLNTETIIEAVPGLGVASVSNVYKGSAELEVCPYLTNEDNWFVINATHPVRPVIVQTEVKPRFVAQDMENDTAPYERHVNSYQGYYRGDCGFGLPQLIVGSTGAADPL